MKNEVRVEVEKEGEPARTLKSDPFVYMATPGQTHASVGFSLGTQQDFGKLKITASVNIVLEFVVCFAVLNSCPIVLAKFGLQD